jgi:hypothetical protein
MIDGRWIVLYCLIGGLVSVGTLEFIYDDDDHLLVYLFKGLLVLVFWWVWLLILGSFVLWLLRRKNRGNL